MHRILAFVILTLSFFNTTLAGPKDSLRLEKRDGATYIMHRVVKGESLSSLAGRYGVAEAQILSTNPLVTEKVFPGSIIKIPVNADKYGAVAAPEIKASTGSRLPLATTLPPPSKAQVVNTTPAVPVNPPVVAKQEPAKPKVEEKPATLPEPKPTVIDFDSNKTLLAQAKQELKPLPPPSGKPIAKYDTYVVGSPQTVQQLAEARSVDPNDIIVANQLYNYKLKVGQKVKIPVYANALASVEPKPQAKLQAEPINQPTSQLKLQAKAKADKAGDKAADLATNGSVSTNDSIVMAKRKRAIAYLAKLDSNYIHPDGVTYKVNNYAPNLVDFDYFSLLAAEENVIEVDNTNQREGYGNKSFVHIVKDGETLQSIARRYRMSTTDIINWNGLITYRVRRGQELVMNANRANIGPYERTIVPPPVEGKDHHLYEDVWQGFAYFDESQNFKGVYMDNVEVGKFIYILNRDNYRETFAKVLGPLPPGMPHKTIVYIDKSTALELKIETQQARVEVSFGILKQNAIEEEEETEDKSEAKAN